MENIINLHIEKLPEGLYLATAEDMPGLVAQGRTLTETLEIARDVARKLLEARRDRNPQPPLTPVQDVMDYPLVIGG
ncbi:MAG: type II toxin-antitoxin system HicB family antitoxin [Gammaproteobacteria bacterium]